MLSREHGVAFCLALRADARSGQLIRAWCCQPCCPPTALQRAPRQMTERKSHRGRDGAFVAHGAPKTTAASWNPRPENPSAVSGNQAGRRSQPHGIGGGPTTGHRLAVERRRWAASSFSLKNKIDFRRAELEMLFLSRTRMLQLQLFSPPRRGAAPRKDAPFFVACTTPGLAAQK